MQRLIKFSDGNSLYYRKILGRPVTKVLLYFFKLKPVKIFPTGISRPKKRSAIFKLQKMPVCRNLYPVVCKNGLTEKIYTILIP